MNMASGVTGSLALAIDLTNELPVRFIGALSHQSNFLHADYFIALLLSLSIIRY